MRYVMRRRSFKTVVVAFMILALLIPTAVVAKGTGSLPPDAGVSKVTIKINGKVQQIPKEMGRAYINKRTSRTMVPIRFVAENLGNKVEFIERQADHPKGAVLIKSDSKTIYFAIGSDQYEIYGDKTQRAYGTRRRCLPAIARTCPCVLYPRPWVTRSTG